MNFYLSNPFLDKQIAEIRRKIRLSMNGEVSERMTEYGIVYKQNFGVSIPRLREMAKSYAKNHDLVRRLWALKIRETMILATLLAEEEKFSLENAFEWLAGCNQMELVEQLCMNLFCRLPYANQFCVKLVQSDKFWEKAAGFVLSARIYQQLTDDEIKLLISQAVKNSATNEIYLYKSIALSLARMSRKNRNTADFILQKIEDFAYSENIGQQYISYEVKEEIAFFDYAEVHRGKHRDSQSCL